ncbi:hypothetical protein ASD81_04380 [Nocardioides sp. Root614]|nr:hypothetical protein ASD81_04380 [Nocardioides sp. Root614]KRA91888.1 hypothetical protein ASD84_04645 [Nocardioides sp. Root682]
MRMAQIVDERAALVLLRPWRTAQATVLPQVVGSRRDGTETIGLDIMPWAEDFAQAFVGHSGHARVDRAVQLAIPLFSGLDYLHEQHTVVHRDIHPSNVMYAEGRLVLVDWGIASNVTDGISTLTAAIGKEQTVYFAPETAAHQRVGRFTDAWAMGMLLCEMACGEPPMRVGGVAGVRLPAAANQLPRWLVAVIEGLATSSVRDRMRLEDAIDALHDAGRSSVAAGGPAFEPSHSTALTAQPAISTTSTTMAQEGPDAAHRRTRAREFFAEGYELLKSGRAHEALRAYLEVISMCDGDPDPIMRQNMAMALNNTQWAQNRLGQHAEAVGTCSRMVHAFGGDSDLLLRRQVATALNGSGYAKAALRLNDGAIADWDAVVTRFGNEPDLVLRRQVAMALRDKGLALSALDRRIDALSTYTRLIESFERDTDLAIRRQVAMALNNKRSCLHRLGHQADALAACTRLVDVFGSDSDTLIRQQVAVALRSKGLLLDRSRQREGALAAYGRLVDIFESDPDPSIQESVGWARRRLRGE